LLRGNSLGVCFQDTIVVGDFGGTKVPWESGGEPSQSKDASQLCHLLTRLRTHSAAQKPHMPCTPPPGGVEAEQRKTFGFGVA
jgi:hypothetical protein